MKNTIVCILALTILISGCSHNLSRYSNESQADFYSRVANLCKDKDELEINLLDGRIFIGKELTMNSDSTSFTNVELDSRVVIPTQKVFTISFDESGRGAFEGFISGILIGGGGALLYDQVIIGESAEKQGLPYLLIYSILAGGGIGAIYGLINPSTTTIQFKLK